METIAEIVGTFMLLSCAAALILGACIRVGQRRK
jgi:hypothetical protein